MRTRVLLPVAGLVFVGVLAYACSDRRGPSRSAGVEQQRAADSLAARRATSGYAVYGRAMVRFVNAMPGSPALEIMADSSSLFGNVVFGAVSPYKPLPGTLVHFALRSSANQALRSARADTLRGGMRYTVLALPDRSGAMTLSVIADDLLPGAGKARIRVIHAVPDDAPIDVRITNQRAPLFTAIRYSSVAGVRDVSPATVGFRFQRNDTRSPIVTLRSMHLTAGTTYTFILTARPRDAFTAIRFSDDASDISRIVAMGPT